MPDHSDPRSPRRNPCFLLAHARLRLGKGLQRVFRDAGHELTPEHWGLLNMIAKSPGARQTQLAESLGKDKPNVSRILATLEKKGLLLREADPRDRRSHRLILTPAGETLLAELTPLVAAYLDRIFSPLDDVDYEIFMKVLRQVGSRLDEFLNETTIPPVAGLD